MRRRETAFHSAFLGGESGVVAGDQEIDSATLLLATFLLLGGNAARWAIAREATSLHPPTQSPCDTGEAFGGLAAFLCG